MKFIKWKRIFTTFSALVIISTIISSCSNPTENQYDNHFTTPEDPIRKQQNQNVLEKIKYFQATGKGYENQIYNKWISYVKESDIQKKHDLYYPDASSWFGIIYFDLEAPYSKDNIKFNGSYNAPYLYDDNLKLVDSYSWKNFDTIGRWFDYDYLYSKSDYDGNLLYLYVHEITLQDAKFKKLGHDIVIEKNPNTLAKINDIKIYTFTPPKNV